MNTISEQINECKYNPRFIMYDPETQYPILQTLTVIHSTHRAIVVHHAIATGTTGADVAAAHHIIAAANAAAALAPVAATAPVVRCTPTATNAPNGVADAVVLIVAGAALALVDAAPHLAGGTAEDLNIPGHASTEANKTRGGQYR